MTIERALALAVSKPWGRTDLQPWSSQRTADGSIGEIRFERSAADAPKPALLLKLLFTSQALSIQVHPDDELARSMGLPNGKSEAWYVLSAEMGAKVARGLTDSLDRKQLRQIVEDGSIAGVVTWREVRAGDFISIPAGTIHAIGADLVIAEIQQRSDTTFRLFDFDRQRPLHIEQGIAAASLQPSLPQAMPRQISLARALLGEDAHFVLEKMELLPVSDWRLRALGETWLLCIGGDAMIGTFALARGEAIFLEGETVAINVGARGFKALIAYPGPVVAPALLEEIPPDEAGDDRSSPHDPIAGALA